MYFALILSILTNICVLFFHKLIRKMDSESSHMGKVEELSVQSIAALPTPQIDTTKSPSNLQFDRLQQLDRELSQENLHEFGQFLVREALLDEEYWVFFFKSPKCRCAVTLNSQSYAVYELLIGPVNNSALDSSMASGGESLGRPSKRPVRTAHHRCGNLRRPSSNCACSRRYADNYRRKFAEQVNLNACS